MYVVYGIIIGTCFQHFMSTLSKDSSDSAKEERIGRACNKARRRDATRRDGFCIFPAFFPPLPAKLVKQIQQKQISLLAIVSLSAPYTDFVVLAGIYV